MSKSLENKGSEATLEEFRYDVQLNNYPFLLTTMETISIE